MTPRTMRSLAILLSLFLLPGCLLGPPATYVPGTVRDVFRKRELVVVDFPAHTVIAAGQRVEFLRDGKVFAYARVRDIFNSADKVQVVCNRIRTRWLVAIELKQPARVRVSADAASNQPEGRVVQ